MEDHLWGHPNHRLPAGEPRCDAGVGLTSKTERVNTRLIEGRWLIERIG